MLKTAFDQAKEMLERNKRRSKLRKLLEESNNEEERSRLRAELDRIEKDPVSSYETR